jgi:flagellar hook protein FlgE
MSQALYTAMGGISAAQTQLNVVSNNIANINTIGFKSSNVTFQDIFSTTMTAGNAPTVTTGGKNPVQIGLGVQVGTIAKNFDSGTWSATGKATDIMIQGNGFFTVKSSDGIVYFTKAGNFSFDAKGDLVNAQGYKVMGANTVFASVGSDKNVNVPQKLVTQVNANDGFATKNLGDLNDCQVTPGTFTVNVAIPGGLPDVPVVINIDANPDGSIASNNDSMAEIADKIQTALTASAAAAVASVPFKTAEAGFYGVASALLTGGALITDAPVVAALASAAAQRALAGDTPLVPAPVNVAMADAAQTAALTAAANKPVEAAGCLGVNVLCGDGSGVPATNTVDTNGTIKFVVDGTDSTGLAFVPGTSSFVLTTQLGSAKIDPLTNTYTSKVCDWAVDITPVVSTINAVSVSNYTIGPDGSIEATYSNGDKMTIEINPADNTFQFKYTTSTGVIIRGADVDVNPNVAIPANFQLQLTNVVNPEGLVSMGGNLFMPGPNAGDTVFTVGGAMGVGILKSGGLEASNVDMSKQFSDMILAQRAVQANSRVFTTTSDIMQTLVQLGR